MASFSSLWQSLIDALIPPRKTERVVRGATAKTLAARRRPFHRDDIEALFSYEDSLVQAIIWELKYYDSSVSAHLLAGALAEELPHITHEALTDTPLLIPIPLHEKRQRARGYNQVARVTELVAKKLQEVEHVGGVLVRIIDTPRQTALSRAKRLSNVKKAFEVQNKEKVSGRVCILVDDVITTGSTLREAGRVLKKAGASRVILLALAHAG